MNADIEKSETGIQKRAYTLDSFTNGGALLSYLLAAGMAVQRELPPRKTMANFSKRLDPQRRRKRKLAKASRRKNRR